jgi:hypothetical protein
MLKKNDGNIDGTSLQGYVVTTYAKLVEAFGEPSHDGDGYKVDAEWVLSNEDDQVVTIYNWKNGPNYCGADGWPVAEITEWHIGGRNKTAVDLVEEAMPTSSVRKDW